VSGQFAYKELEKIVHSEGWDHQPALVQRQIYEKVFKKSRDMAQMMALAGEDPEKTKEAVEKVIKALGAQK
jgi:hypothetical protein